MLFPSKSQAAETGKNQLQTWDGAGRGLPELEVELGLVTPGVRHICLWVQAGLQGKWARWDQDQQPACAQCSSPSGSLPSGHLNLDCQSFLFV